MKRTPVLIFVLLAPVLTAAAEPKLIPRKALFGNPVKASPQISPDGKTLAYVAPDAKDVLQVWVRGVNGAEGRVVTADKKRGIRQFFWTYAPDTLAYLQDNDGDENYHVYSVNLKTMVVRDLTPFQGVRAMPVGTDKHFPNEVLVALNVESRQSFDVYRVSLGTGATVLDTKNPGTIINWVTDANFRVRAAETLTPDGGKQILVRADDKSPFKPVVTFGPDDADGDAVGFTKDGHGLYLKSSQNRDTLALIRRDLGSGKEVMLAQDPGADAGEVMTNPDTHEIEAVAFNRERLKWKALDETIAADLKFLQDAGKGEPTVGSEDAERKTWVVTFSADVTPASYYLYDRTAKKLAHLFDARPELAKYTLAPMKPVTIKSRDGLELVCYLTLPPGKEPKNLPAVLFVHGGPWARDNWGYHPYHQWLANRGYAVLSVNYRGSTGLGKTFLHAGDREWAGKMHDDLIDAVQWLVKDGVADEKKVGIMGGSYGGYAALVGATFTPEVFACAVDIVGPSNLITLLKSIPPYWAPMKKIFDVRVGDSESLLRERSPLFKVDQIKIPLLIAQGANDPRVKQAESEQIVEAMKKAGKPVEYMLFPDEGHGFARPENQLKFAAAAEAFLAKHLGGRAEPAGK
ncbi:MAG: S9 family peptidase [Gemmataceae bacterium]